MYRLWTRVSGAEKANPHCDPGLLLSGTDNGLLSLAAQGETVKQAIELTNSKYFLSRVSATFHGRDIFAPVAAHLTRGSRPGMFGPRLNSWAKLDIPQPVITGRELVGNVFHVDAFGNLITNIRERGLLNSVGSFRCDQGGRKKRHRFEKRVLGSQERCLDSCHWKRGFLELSVREGSAKRC